MYEDDNIITTFNGELEEVYVRRNNTVDELIDYKFLTYKLNFCTQLKKFGEGNKSLCQVIE